MLHLGDITKIKGCVAPTVDCIIGGSPCQDLSLAGKRAGLAGARSGLYMEQIRIIKEMRQADAQRGNTDVDVRPRYMVWENVPGAFSTNGGQDFAAVLEEAIRVAEPEAPSVDVPEKGWPTSGCFFDEMGKWSVAWRVLDAQFWGVPQRRRRIALIADFGGLSAPEILFVRKGVSGNIEPGEPKRKETAPDSGESSGGAVGCDLYNGAVSGDIAVSLNTNANATGAGSTVAIPKAVGFPLGFRPENVRCYDEVATTLCNGTRPGFTTGVIPPVISVDQGGGKSGANSYDDVSPTLTCTHGGEPAVAYTYDARGNGDGQTVSTLTGDHQNRVTDYTSVVGEPVVYEMQAFGNYKDSGISPTLAARDYKSARDLVVEGIAPSCRILNPSDSQGNQVVDGTGAGIYPTLRGCGGAGYQQGYVMSSCSTIAPAVDIRHIVRRLTPLECERLQGFPDGWTDIGEWADSKGKKHKEADSPRYKALGNSIALPPWKWVLKRLCACYERDATMASLFDGIGGFPYIWEQLNGKGSCLWASEIEEFPMAVTKVRFGDGSLL